MRTASPRAIVIACAASFAAGIATIALFGFGPLDPPDGPISPTYKTLSEVEPRTAINATNTPGDGNSKFKITKPGSYYLAGNLTGVSGKSGIEVAANCTLDLCGFQVIGVNGSLDGISLVAGFHGTLRNGQVVKWGGNGIGGLDSLCCLFEDLYIEGCGGSGIVAGADSVLSRVRTLFNDTGIEVDGSCTIVDCTASNNVQTGITAGGHSTVSRCNARGNGGIGIDGGGANISDCVSSSNGVFGIYASGGIVRDNVCDGNAEANICSGGAGGAIVRNNSCSDSPGSGIRCQAGSSTVDSNMLTGNYIGVFAAENGHNLVVRNYTDATTFSSYYILPGNNWADILNIPGQGFASTNSWANIAGN